MDYMLSVAVLVLLFATVGVTFNWLQGYCGLFSVAQAAFIGVGAYTTAILQERYDTPFLLTVPAAFGVAAILGALVGYTAVRVSGIYLVIASFGMQEIGTAVFKNATGLTNGAIGISVPTVFAPFGTTGNWTPLVDIGILAVVCFAVSIVLARSTVGLRMRALRQDEAALRACGVNTTRIKLLVHILSLGVAGVAGIVYAQAILYVSPDDFGLDTSIQVLAVVAVGGAANSFGPLLGAILVVGAPQLLSFTPMPDTLATPVQQMLYGVLLVVLMVFRRNGLLNEDYRSGGPPAGSAEALEDRAAVRESGASGPLINSTRAAESSWR